MKTPFRIEEDDLSSESTQALLALHLANMHATSPPEHVFALDWEGLKAPEITVWSIRDGDRVIGVGALRTLNNTSGEIKSMRTHPDYLRRGVGAAILDHIIATARARGWTRLSLETGSGPVFEAALQLYRTRGFVEGEAFSNYKRSTFNQFFHLTL